MYVPIPNYMSPPLPPGVIKYEPTSRATAAALLTADGFPINPQTQLRYWDRNSNQQQDAGEEFTIKIWGRVDHTWRNDMAMHISAELNAINVATELLLRVRQECSDNVFGAKNFDIYTGGWIFIGPDPDYLYDLYHSSSYWHPGKPPNYAVYPLDPVNDALLEQIKFANTPEEAYQPLLDWMVYWSAQCFSVACMSTSGYKSYRVDYLGTPGTPDGEDQYEGEAWYGMLNENGFGVNSFWSFMDAHPADHPMGNYVAPGPGQMTMRYGFKTTEVSWLNPIYAQWYWDWETIGKIYDAGAGRDPYNKQLWIPQLFKKWVASTWVDPDTLETKTKITITIRPDAYWQDGTPFSVADVEYTLVELSKDLIAKNLPTPWFYPTVQFMRSFYQVDAYTIEILMDVKSTYAMGWVIGTVIIPKHIWKPIVDASTVQNNIVYGRNPDMNMIGTGPYRLHTYAPTPAVPMYILLVANKPGSTVQTDFVDGIVHTYGTPITSPYGYFNQEPTYMNVYPSDLKFKRNVLPTAPDTSFTLTINEENREREQFRLRYIGGPDMPPYIGSIWQGVWPETLGPITDIHGMHYLQGISECSFVLTSWEDNGNGFLDVCDIIDMEEVQNPGKTLWFHVEAMTPPPFPPGQITPQTVIELKEVLIVNKYVYVDGVLLQGFPIDVYLIPGITYTETIPLTLKVGIDHTVKVAFHIKNDWTLSKSNDVLPNPWHSHWENATVGIWITIKQDIAGRFFDMWHTAKMREVPLPDYIVEGKDIALVARAFDTNPGHPRWSAVADITGDYYVEGLDIANVAKMFNWVPVDP
jgi:ABC-type transport system substrate-binding protein